MMRIAGFEFAEGARFQSGAHLDPEAVGRHIEKLRELHKGELTPQDVLADASDEASPLHSFFEWSDTAAAEQFRLQQARGLIRAVVARYVSNDKPMVKQRAYVHINEPAAPHYREAGHAMSQVKTRQMVLQQAWRELQQWKKRYRDIIEFSDLFEVIDEVEKHLPKPGRVAS